MCGIVGGFVNTSIAMKDSFIDAIRHRGPDDYGYFMDGDLFLGHTRVWASAFEI